jgi:two-component system, chemotaxis family, protein-glutamate methylesterase/glutaminase
VLSEGLGHDAGLEVVGTAANGHIALSKIPLLSPDLITLDVEMPEMDGLQTLAAIRKLYPKLPVIMFSTLTERGAATTLEALSRGASDYVTKPSNTGSLDVTLRQLREQLIPKIKALCPPLAENPAVPITEMRPSPSALPKLAAGRVFGRIDVLAIGTSTGGPNALAVLMKAIPANFPVPVVIVQHMPPVFTRLLASRLNENSALTIREAAGGEILSPGEAWIAPGDFHMTVERKDTSVRIALNQDPPENFCRPAVDPLFRSVAKVFGPNVLAVVLTGMGSDGSSGATHIRERGGQILVQDEASSVVWGMPGQIAAAGLADAVYSITDMGREIDRRVAMHRRAAANVPLVSTGTVKKGELPQRQ